jgi:hypothetical protein
VTFRDLQRLVQSQEDDNDTAANNNRSLLSSLVSKLQGKPFWIWEKEDHKWVDKTDKGNCCFNHIIGLPRKDGVEKPLFDYEKILYKALVEPGYINSGSNNSVTHDFKVKHLWIKKATGLGVTEFMLRFMAWLCLKDDSYQNSQMVIVTGPNQELAIKLIKRMKLLFEPHGFRFDTKETTLSLNGCEIQAYPSNHIDAFRSLTNPKFILIDEGDFFRKNEQEEVRHVAERYIAKSDPYIVMVSTPNAPGGLFERIEKEPFDTCIYKKMFLDYTYGVDRIYTKEEIDKARMSPSFEREYMLKYQGLIGNVFSQLSIEKATKIKYSPDKINQNAKKSIGVDPGFGSGKFAIVVTQLVNGRIEVIHAEEHDRPNFSDMIAEIWNIKNKCGYISNIYVDAANPEVWGGFETRV